MKALLQRLITVYLQFWARRRLYRTNPVVIAISGSVGKSTTREAVFAVIGRQADTLCLRLNTDIGIALELLGWVNTPSLWEWIVILFLAPWRSTRTLVAKYLIVELGVDHPGDAARLARLLRPDILIISWLSAAHLGPQGFADEAEMVAEETYFADRMAPTGIVILNIDNPWMEKIQTRIAATVLTVSRHRPADLRLLDWHTSETGSVSTLLSGEETMKLETGLLAPFLLQTVLPAVLLARQLGVPPEKIQASLRDFQPPRGRFNKINARNRATIIDSSYNSSPAALKECLSAVLALPAKRRIAVLGTMNELGEEAGALHAEIGQWLSAQERTYDLVVTIGEMPRLLHDHYRQSAGGEAKHVDHLLAALPLLAGELAAGTLILVKGSQNRVFLEEVIKNLMDDPREATALLVRQSAVWQTKKARYLSTLGLSDQQIHLLLEGKYLTG